MAILHVRNVPDDLYERLKKRAAAERRSLSAEVIALLEIELAMTPTRHTLEADPSQVATELAEIGRAERERVSRMSIKELFAEIDRTREAHPLPPGAPEVVDLIREDRER